MELIITSLFLFNILNTNAIYITNDIQNNTLMIERNEWPLERTSNYSFDVRSTMQTAVPLDENCVTNEECRTRNSYCEFSLASFDKTCKCKRDYVRVFDTCLGKVSLDNPCFTSKQCQTPNSICGQSSYMSYKSCKCKPDYIRINGNCSKKAFLDERCLTDEQCKTDNAICTFEYFATYKACKCRLNYINVYGRCLKKVPLGSICSFTKECLTLNSYCEIFCQCQAGYREDNGKCVSKVYPLYPSKHNDLDNGIIALFSIFAVIVTVIIIFTVISYFRKRSATQSRTHIPPAYTVQLPPNIDGSHTNAAILQSQAAGSTIYDFDKPPSYEDVVRS